jgi:PilZ domain
MSETNLRRHHRVQYIGPARISWEDARGLPQYAQGRCLDISKSGLRIALEVFEPIPIRSCVSLRLERIKVASSATVKHVTRRGAKYLLGLELREAFGRDALAVIGSG